MKKEKTIRSQMLSNLAWVYRGLLFVLLLLIWQIIYIRIFEAERLKKIYEKNNLKERIIEASRGDILARDGRLLVSSLPYYEIRLDFGSPSFDVKELNEKVDSLSFLLNKIFGDKSQRQYKEDLLSAASKHKKFHLLKI